MKHNFTLIEILAVTLLISLLAAIGIAGYTYAVESSKEKATIAMIHRLSVAFDALREEGLLPKTVSNGSTTYLNVAFNPDPTAGGNDAGELLYYSKNSNKTDPLGANKAARVKAYKLFAKSIETDNIARFLDADNQIIDGWGNPIYIRYPGKINRGGFDIISAGPDGLFGENAATTPPDEISKYRDDDGQWICDDIANI